LALRKYERLVLHSKGGLETHCILKLKEKEVKTKRGEGGEGREEEVRRYLLVFESTQQRFLIRLGIEIEHVISLEGKYLTIGVLINIMQLHDTIS